MSLISHIVVYMKRPRYIPGCNAECENGDSFEDLCPFHHDQMVKFYIEQDAKFDDAEALWEEMV